MSDSTFVRDSHDNRVPVAAAASSGEMRQLANGRAAFLTGLGAAAAGDPRSFQDEGIVSVPKTASIVILDGGRVYWDHSANTATYRTANDRDFYLGTAVGDAAGTDANVQVNLNKRPRYEVSLQGDSCDSQGDWITEATLGLGVTLLPGGGAQLAFDAVAEAAQAALYSSRTVPISSNPIFEARVAVFDKGDATALDMDIGLANGSHATDFETVAEFCAFHFDGNSLNIYAHSDDGTTDVTVTDTTVDNVDDTYFELWIDARNPADIQMYVNGVLVLGSTVFTWAAATGVMRPIIMIEKTSDDTTADIRVDFMRMRIAEQ